MPGVLAGIVPLQAGPESLVRAVAEVRALLDTVASRVAKVEYVYTEYATKVKAAALPSCRRVRACEHVIAHVS